MLCNSVTVAYCDDSYASYVSIPFRCFHCNKQSDVAEDIPVLCDRCKAVRYCSEEHKIEGFASGNHRVLCHEIEVSRIAFEQILRMSQPFVEEQIQLEEVQVLFRTLDIPASEQMQYVRSRPVNVPFEPPNAFTFEDAFAQQYSFDLRFEDGYNTINRLYDDLSSAIRQLGTREAFGRAALLSATQPRLDQFEAGEARATLAPDLFLGDYDQECYDHCKYFITITKKHQHNPPPWSFLSAKGQDILEDIEFCNLDEETPYCVIPLFFLKFKLLLDTMTVHAIRQSLKNRLPEEIIQLIFSFLSLRSPLSSKMFVKVNERQRSKASKRLKTQVVRLGQMLQRECCFFTPILLLELLDVMGPDTGMCLHSSCASEQPKCDIDQHYLEQGYYVKAALSFGSEPLHRLVGAIDLLHQVERRVSKKQGRKPLRAFVDAEDFLRLGTRRPLLLKLGIEGAQDYFAGWWDEFGRAVDEEISI